MRLRQHQRGQEKGAEFAYGRRSEDIAAKITVAVGFTENRNEHAECGRRQHNPDEQRCSHQPDHI